MKRDKQYLKKKKSAKIETWIVSRFVYSYIPLGDAPPPPLWKLLFSLCFSFDQLLAVADVSKRCTRSRRACLVAAGVCCMFCLATEQRSISKLSDHLLIRGQKTRDAPPRRPVSPEEPGPEGDVSSLLFQEKTKNKLQLIDAALMRCFQGRAG